MDEGESTIDGFFLRNRLSTKSTKSFRKTTYFPNRGATEFQMSMSQVLTSKLMIEVEKISTT